VLFLLFLAENREIQVKTQQNTSKTTHQKYKNINLGERFF
jgi:hypothetical protein